MNVKDTIKDLIYEAKLERRQSLEKKKTEEGRKFLEQIEETWRCAL